MTGFPSERKNRPYFSTETKEELSLVLFDLTNVVASDWIKLSTLWMKAESVYLQMKAQEQHFLVVLFVMRHMVPTFQFEIRPYLFLCSAW